MIRLLATSPINQSAGVFLVRVAVGCLLVYHGIEVFDSLTMQKYLTWDIFKNSSGETLVYAGKIMELAAGVLFVLGFCNRLACVLTIAVMGYITFFVGKGRFWYEEQHPFLFILLALILFFTGPGKWSLDNVLFDKSRN